MLGKKARPIGATYTLTIAEFAVEVIRKPIKHLHLRLQSATGQLQVSAPFRLNDLAIHQLVLAKRDWIRHQQAKLTTNSLANHDDQIRFLGQWYQLGIVEAAGPAAIRLDANQTVLIQMKPGSTSADRLKRLESWYRDQLQLRLKPLLVNWANVIAVPLPEWRIKRMTTRWGTCNASAKRLWFSLELAKQALPLIEYVVVHELVHLLEIRHNTRFYGFMDQYLPDWRQRRLQLNGKTID